MKRSVLPVLMGFALLLLSSTEGWSLPPCEGSPTSGWSTTSNWTDCVGTIIFSDGSKYVGEWKNRKWHGQGTLYLPDGRVKEGIWENSYLLYAKKPSPTVTAKKTPSNGSSLPPCPDSPVSNWEATRNWTGCFGTVFLADGDKYVGEFKDGKIHGQGTFTYASGRVKEGIWENGKFLYANKTSPTVTAKKSPKGDFQKGMDAYEKKDYATALREWKPLAEQGDAPAQYNLGMMYHKGQGVPQDYKTAVKWYRLAAEQGNASAQGNLGAMYAFGTGGLKDYVYAHMWGNIAAANGNEMGAKLRDDFEKKMTPTQIADA